MKLTIIISTLLLMSLSSYGNETTSYFICTYETDLPKRYSLVIDTQKKTLKFDTKEERNYEESASNYLESELPWGMIDGDRETVQFDKITGRLRYMTLYTDMSGHRVGKHKDYQCKKSEKLI